MTLLLITVNNTAINQSLKILQIEGILCNLTFNVNDTIKYNPKKDSFLTICKNNPIVFNGILRDSSGIYRDTFVNNKGCDSFLILNLTVIDTTKKDSFLSICRYQPITFNGQSLTLSGIYKDTLTNAQGCDSFLYLHLTVNDSSRKDSFRNSCKNYPITFNGMSLNTSGIYKDTLVNARGCDSFLYLHLTVNDTSRKDSFKTICYNQSIVFNGQTINTSGTYRDTLVNAKGCDSFLVLFLTVNDCLILNFLDTQSYCKGIKNISSGLSILGRPTAIISSAKVYFENYVAGEDTLLITTLAPVTSSFNTTTGVLTLSGSATIGRYDTILRTIQYRKKTQSFTASTKKIRITLGDALHNPSNNHFYRLVNNGSPLTWTAARNAAAASTHFGMQGYLVTVTDSNENNFLKSLISAEFWIGASDANSERTWRWVAGCEGTESSGLGRHFGDQTGGCPGVGGFTNVGSNYSKWEPGEPNEWGCNEDYGHLRANGDWNDYPENGYGIVSNYVVEYGCMPNDPIVQLTGQVLLHIKPMDTFSISHSMCQGNVFLGRSVTGTYIDTFNNQFGCDSIRTLQLLVKDTSRKDSFRTICKNYPIVFNGQTLNTTGVYRDTFINAKGCDSFLVLNLTVNDTTKKDSFRSICRYQPITFNGQILTISGIYKDTFTNAKGCDSFLYLHLTVNDTTKKDSFRNICRNNPILFNGQWRNVSGTYKDTLVNVKGCDSFLYLHLTVNDTTKKDSFRTICRNYPIVFNGQTINTSGIYRDTFVNAIGCDSFLYLHLTVNDTTKKDSFRTICRNYPIVFNGQNLNTTGIYRDTFVNAQGCDSFLYLHLTVTDTTRKDSFHTICINQPVVFNGQTLNTTGVYKDTLVNAKGCDSFLYLHLTVNPLPIANAGIDQSRVNCAGDSIRIGTTENTNYSYNWTPNAFLSNDTEAQPWVKVLSSTNYILRVTDNNTGCMQRDTVRVNVIPNYLNASKQVKHIQCFGQNNGQINLNAQNGYPNYTYKLGTNNFIDSGQFYNLNPGIFQFTIQDAKGCLYSDTFFIAEPPALKIDNEFKKNIRCHQGDDGEIQVWVSGGITPYQYKWSSSSLDSSAIRNLKAMTHTLTVTDKNGCITTGTYTLTEPNPLQITDTLIQKNKCRGDSMASIHVFIQGGVQPYTYIWNNGNTTKEITNLKQGNYILTVTDAVLCSMKHSFSIIDYPQLVLDSIIALDFNCDFEGSIILAARGGLPPYEYSVDGGISFQKNSRIKVEKPDTYQVHIRDNNDCIIKSSTRVKGPKRMEIQAYPKDTLTLPGEPVLLGFDYILGDPNNVQTILWKPSDGLSCTDCTNPIATPHAPMLYTVTIFYNNRCATTETINIRHNTDNNELYIPNSFSPTSANIENQTFKIYSNLVRSARLIVFNRLGEKMFETDDATHIGWDGTYQGQELGTGVYIYHAEINYIYGRTVKKSGSVTLLR